MTWPRCDCPTCTYVEAQKQANAAVDAMVDACEEHGMEVLWLRRENRQLKRKLRRLTALLQHGVEVATTAHSGEQVRGEGNS